MPSKHRHAQDRMYITATEWKNEWGGKKKKFDPKEFKRLPFDHCALTFTPFENPHCTRAGVIYDLTAIIPFIKKYGVEPSTGEPITRKDLIKVNFYKNNDGDFHDPVTYRVFTENTKIALILTSGNVYCYQTLEQLNFKPAHWNDLISDDPFTRRDIRILQDPADLSSNNLLNFYYLKNNLKVDEKIEGFKNFRTVNKETHDIIKTVNKDFKESDVVMRTQDKLKGKGDKINSAIYSTGRAGASFTSTAMDVFTKVEAAALEEDTVRYKRINKKGYVRLVTNHGLLNLELFCAETPKTCENFIKLCGKNYYRGTIFHRLIRNFIVQGGDPTGKGTGGDSFWGGTFKDECRKELTHTGRGMLSMANSGKDTNKSQFFITFRSCNQLDRKHTIFGKLVGGLDVLTKIEMVEVDKKTDRPLEEVKILDTIVFVDPFAEVDEQLEKEREELRTTEEAARKPVAKISAANADNTAVGVGKYLKKTDLKQFLSSSGDAATSGSDKKGDNSKRKAASLNDFSSW